MQETYGVSLLDYDLDGELPGRESWWLAALCAGLPSTCRVNRAEDPDAAWSQEQWTLWAIDQRIQQLVQKGARSPKKPRPLETPSRAARLARAEESARRNKAEVDRVLFGTGGDG